MDYILFAIGFCIFIISLFFAYKKRYNTKAWISSVTLGVLLSVFFMVLPTEWSKSEDALIKPLYNIISALHYSFKVLGGRQDISQLDKISFTGTIRCIYILLNYAAFIASPLLGSSLILSFVGDTLSKIRYAFPTLRKTYVFSELNDNSLLIAKGLKSKRKTPQIVFCDTKKADASLIESARKLHGITLFCKCDSLKMKKLAGRYEFCAVSENEDKNIELTRALIEKYHDNTDEKINITAFAKSNTNIRLIEKMLEKSESDLSVRFIDKIALFCNNLIYENPLYSSAEESKKISVMIVGCGETGLRMLRTAAWYGQIDGYTLEIRVYDKKADAIEKIFYAECPGFASCEEYDIRFIKTDACSADFEEKIKENKQDTDSTVAYVFTDNDSLNLEISDRLFRIFRKSRGFGSTPKIFARIDDKSKFSLFSDKNEYLKDRNIVLAGNVENLFSDKTFFNSNLENLALAVHLCYNGALGLPSADKNYKDAVRNFKTSEYDRRSSMAAAIHITAKLQSCGILDAGDYDLTMRKAFRFEKYMKNCSNEEHERLYRNEHARWNAFMRSEGYTPADIETVRKYAFSNNSHKDELSKTHPCITSWDGLTPLENFAKNELGKKNCDFRKYDIETVNRIPEIIMLANKLNQEEQ